jgi:hypothetical protein
MNMSASLQKVENFIAESLFLILILRQQKIVNELIGKINDVITQFFKQKGQVITDQNVPFCCAYQVLP